MSKKVELSDVTRMYRLFKKKNWNQKPNEDTVFTNFCILLDNLNSEQKELIHELVENYVWISGSEYEIQFNNLLNIVYNKALSNCQKVYVIPIIKPTDRNKIKSGEHCVYLLRGILSLNSHYHNIDYKILDDFEKIQAIKFKNDGSEQILFIDDFIGTGDTFDSFWGDISKNVTITKENTIIISLVIQKDGLNLIQQKFDLDIYYKELSSKGITDYFPSPTKEEKAKIMQEIEKIIQPGNYSFGYKGSEALVTMIRTPNNTFPVFWKKYKIQDQLFIPPFVRH